MGQLHYVCTDGAKAVVGRTASAVSRIKAIAKNRSRVYCIIHRQVCIISQEYSTFLENYPHGVRKNKKRYGIGRIHTCLLLYIEVRWLSRGKILLRLFELRESGEFDCFPTLKEFYEEVGTD